jgi:hypothetical protein
MQKLKISFTAAFRDTIGSVSLKELELDVNKECDESRTYIQIISDTLSEDENYSQAGEVVAISINKITATDLH